MFSILISTHLQWYLYGEFVHQFRAFLVADHFPDFMTFMSHHFPYSHDLNFLFKVLLSGEIRCQSLLGIKRLRETDIKWM